MADEGVDRGATLGNTSTGFLGLLGVKIDEAGPDKVVLSMDVGPDHTQPHGVTHGGVHCTLVESAASIGGHLWQAGAGTVVGVANHTNFLRPFTTGRLLTTATPIFRGRTQQLWQVEIVGEDGRLIARGEVRLQNISLA